MKISPDLADTLLAMVSVALVIEIMIILIDHFY